MTLLDKIPDSTWFFCFPMSIAVFCITVLGIIHPFLWIKIMKVYRSELFVFIYALIVFWAVLSVALFYAIFAESHCIYAFWIWYTIVFSIVMAGLMFLLFCGFCVLAMRRKSIVALLGVVYYLVTLYFVVVVNKQRKEVFGLAATCGSCAIKHVFPIYGESTPDPRMTYNMSSSVPVYTAYPENKGSVRIENNGYPARIENKGPGESAPTETMPTTTTTMTTTTTALTTWWTTWWSPIQTAASTTSVPRPAMGPAMEALMLAREGQGEDQMRPHANYQKRYSYPTRQTRTTETPDERAEAIARLSDILINSNECRRPRKPAHGHFQSTGRRGAVIKLTLHCDPGYRESSSTTQCKYNWWDRPIPQCRKRKPPGPPPLPGGGCILPGYPSHGEYRVAEHARARPGDRVAGDNVVLLVTCDEPYRPLDPYVICVEGRWRHAPPSCLKHCKLAFHPNVEYRCLKEFKDEFLACSPWQPQGAVVEAACRPGHAHRGPFRHMRCRGDAWDHVVTCAPNANFTGQ